MRRRPSHDEMMEIGELGDQIYERDVESQLTDADHGAMIAIDVDTGEWAVGIEAVRVLDKKKPNARILGVVHSVGPRMGFGGTSFSVESEDAMLNSER